MNDPQSPLTVRRAEPEDYPAVSDLFAGPKAVWGTLQLPFPSREDWRKRLAEPKEQYVGLVGCRSDQIIGMVTLHLPGQLSRRRHAGQIGLTVRDDCQGQGVGSALLKTAIDLAENWLNFTRLELQVYADNAPALRLYEKFAFVIEGTHRQYALRDGRLVDALSLARLRPFRAGPS